ncbi:MAG: hypothetical protein DMG74_19605 [Acidobacteria bacterium]|nr:MAG: hypothetical protein DMG74_19605 [Acidobacteriota bacterium]
MKRCNQKLVWLTCMAVASAAACTTPAQGQARPFSGSDVQTIYQRLLGQINQIPVFDNHGHPGFPDDSDVDAMTISPDSALPFRLRENNPEMAGAAKALFGYPYNDLSPDHLRWLVQRKAEEKKRLGNSYFSHVLDLVGIETAVANRVAMSDYLPATRFRWVFFVDSFLFPFDNRQLASRNPDQKLNLPLQEKILRRNIVRAHFEQLPADLSGYLSFITRILEENQKAGGVGIKFEIAYFRSLHFDDPSQQRATAIYTKYHAGGVPSAEEYRDFQNFIFRYLLREAGQLHLPVQIHTAVGGGDYFSLQDGNVLNLENVLRDPRYENVTFILLHGGFPYERQAIWLAAKKNVYLDSSLMGIFLYPDEFKKSLRVWLETFPNKIVFGSDAFPLGDAIGAEENYWLATQSASVALTEALAEMVSAGEVNEDQALHMAHAYLHDTASHLYGSVH